jgi:hypothetical protein
MAWRGRLRGTCRACPNTAWLLFLMFAVGLLVLVSLSVYLSKKRLNLAVLGIGVVRAPFALVLRRSDPPPPTTLLSMDQVAIG